MKSDRETKNHVVPSLQFSLSTEQDTKAMMRANEFCERGKRNRKKDLECICNLTQQLYRKGFDGLYVRPGSGPNKLEIHLENILSYAVRNPVEDVFPIWMKTYINLPNQAGVYKTCAFCFDYDQKKGLHVTQMELQSKIFSQETPQASHHLAVTDLKAIPSVKKANDLVRPLNRKAKKSNRIK